MKKFTLPISPDYVAHWGVWEAVREIYQNALDAAEDGSCKAFMNCLAGEPYELHITTTSGTLSPETLVLGKSTKRDDPKLRGKFGEGYKLALLVLARLKMDVEILTGNERWTVAIERDEQFKSDVLNIYIAEHEATEGVQFIIRGVTFEQWSAIEENVIEKFGVLEEAKQKGRIYVGGLYVYTAKGFHCGYSFKAGEIKLDRDRGMVNGFDLAYKTSWLWTYRSDKLAMKLMKEKAPDVEYVEAHAAATSPLAIGMVGHFRSRYGTHAIPVSNQNEIERAQKAGVKWILVTEAAKNILRTVMKWTLPNHKSVLDQLKDFRKKYEYRMASDMQNDIDEIIQNITGEKK